MYFETIIGTDISSARKWLELGEVVGIPTETVYGLAGNALNADTVLKIFTVKERPHFDPLIVHTFSVNEVEKYVEDIPAMAQDLMEKFMPGPLTILLKKKAIIPDIVTSGLDTVAITVPDHPLTLELLRQLSFPLAAPSANPFGYISPTNAQHVLDQLATKIPYILDGGPAHIGVESTIVGFEDDIVTIHRIGGLAVEDIEKVIGKVQLNIQVSSNPQAPGMLKSHYAPRKPLLFGVAAFEADSNFKKKKMGVIAFDKYVNGFDEQYQILLSPTGDLNEAAKNLFAAMRKLDTGDVDLIYAVEFPKHGLGLAINDRLERAAS